MSLENYVSMSALWVNGKMTICPFATPIFSIKTGTFLARKHSHKKN